MTTWNGTTQTITNAVMSAPFGSADIGRGFVFVIGTDMYFGRIKTVLSATSVVLYASPALPSTDGIVAQAYVESFAGRTYQSYIDEIDSKIQDSVPKLSDADKVAALQSAVMQYGIDQGFTVKRRIAGNGSSDYNLATVLGSEWVYGFTTVRGVEYPVDQKPAAMLNNDAWQTIDDGTATDGSNIALRFLTVTPQATEFFTVEISLQLSLPQTGMQNFPDTDENFGNITTLASAYCCQRLAAAYAPSSDSTITADSVDYHDKSAKYTALAREYQKRYNRAVFGSETAEQGVKGAIIEGDLPSQASDMGDYLFHRRR